MHHWIGQSVSRRRNLDSTILVLNLRNIFVNEISEAKTLLFGSVI